MASRSTAAVVAAGAEEQVDIYSGIHRAFWQSVASAVSQRVCAYCAWFCNSVSSGHEDTFRGRQQQEIEANSTRTVCEE